MIIRRIAVDTGSQGWAGRSALALALAIVMFAATESAYAQGQRIARPGIGEITPNPFNPDKGILRIAYFLPSSQSVALTIFAMDGRLVAPLIHDVRSGTNEITWDGRAVDGTIVPNGVYIVRMVAGKNVVSKNAVVMR